jgi:hypothetical protein
VPVLTWTGTGASTYVDWYSCQYLGGLVQVPVLTWTGTGASTYEIPAAEIVRAM